MDARILAALIICGIIGLVLFALFPVIGYGAVILEPSEQYYPGLAYSRE